MVLCIKNFIVHVQSLGDLHGAAYNLTHQLLLNNQVPLETNEAQGFINFIFKEDISEFEKTKIMFAVQNAFGMVQIQGMKSIQVNVVAMGVGDASFEEAINTYKETITADYCYENFHADHPMSLLTIISGFDTDKDGSDHNVFKDINGSIIIYNKE